LGAAFGAGGVWTTIGGNGWLLDWACALRQMATSASSDNAIAANAPARSLNA